MDNGGGRRDISGEAVGRLADEPLSARSFVVRALLERNGRQDTRAWHGFVTDVVTGERQAWRRTSDVVRFIQRRLTMAGPGTSRPGSGGPDEYERVDAMPSPPLNAVVTDMLAELSARLPLAPAGLPEPNVTLERVSERLLGLGNHRGDEHAAAVGVKTLRGGRLEARVRFQLWGPSVADVDAGVLALHADLLEDRDPLRLAGFLKLAGVGTTLAEHVDTVGAWRKTTSFDTLYEYRYTDSDAADSLIARIPITTDPERAGSPARETGAVTDDIIRWDSEAAPPLVLTGPTSVHRISALAHVPSPPVGGTVTLQRVSGSAAPVVHLPDLEAFLDAVGGTDPSATDADVTVATGELFAVLAATGDGIELGDWDADGTPDAYAGFDRALAAPILLPATGDQLAISYTAPGPAPGLDQAAVIYLRVNAP